MQSSGLTFTFSLHAPLLLEICLLFHTLSKFSKNAMKNIHQTNFLIKLKMSYYFNAFFENIFISFLCKTYQDYKFIIASTCNEFKVNMKTVNNLIL